MKGPRSDRCPRCGEPATGRAACSHCGASLLAPPEPAVTGRRGLAAAAAISSAALIAAALLATRAWSGRREAPPARAPPTVGDATAEEGASQAEAIAADEMASRVAHASALASCGEDSGLVFFVGPEHGVSAVPCREAADVQLQLWDGRELLGRIAWRDDRLGLTAVEVPGAAAHGLDLGDAASLTQGQRVFQAVETGAAVGIIERRILQVGRNVLGVAFLRLERGSAGDGALGPLLDARGRLLGMIPGDQTGSEALELAVPVEYLRLRVPGVQPASPEEQERWRLILEKVAEEDSREVDAFAERFGQPVLVQATVSGLGRLEGLVALRHTGGPPPATDRTVELRQGGNVLCAARGTVDRWTSLEAGLGRLAPGGSEARRFRWALRRGAAGDLYLGPLPLDVGACPAEGVGPEAALFIALGEEAETPVKFPRAALAEAKAQADEKAARVQEEARPGGEGRREAESERQRKQKAEEAVEASWRDAFRQAHERIERLEAMLAALKEKERRAWANGEWFELGSVQQQIPAAERDVEKAKEELDELDRQASRNAIPREWRR